MNAADLIISHSGAGSIIEALSLRKILIVVVNTSLQGNHQTELSDVLMEESYCLSTCPSSLLETLASLKLSIESNNYHLKEYPRPNHDIFPQIVDSLFE